MLLNFFRHNTTMVIFFTCLHIFEQHNNVTTCDHIISLNRLSTCFCFHLLRQVQNPKRMRLRDFKLKQSEWASAMWNLHSRRTLVLVLRHEMKCRPLTFIVQVLLQEWGQAHVEPSLPSSTSSISKCASGLLGTVSSSSRTSSYAHSANANSDSSEDSFAISLKLATTVAR